MLQDIQQIIPSEEMRSFCERYGLAELALFGWILRPDFGPDSDVDILVTFAEDHQVSLGELLAMEDELTAILGRDVDLVEAKAMQESQNYIRKSAILDSAVLIHAEACDSTGSLHKNSAYYLRLREFGSCLREMNTLRKVANLRFGELCSQPSEGWISPDSWMNLAV